MALEPQLTALPTSELRPLLASDALDTLKLDDALRREVLALRSQLGLIATTPLFRGPTQASNDDVLNGVPDLLDIPDRILVSARFERLLKDMRELPLGEGDARPTDRDLDMTDSLLSSHTYNLIGVGFFAHLIQHGATAFSDFYNGFKVHDPERADLFWNNMKYDPHFRMVLDSVARTLARSISGPQSDDEKFGLAMEDMQKFFGNEPTQYLNAKTPAFILLSRMKDHALEAFTRILLLKATSKQIPLLSGGATLENPEVFRDSLYVAQQFQAMDKMAYLDMIANPLGQAQTANPTQAESYFRRRESVPGTPVHNNFGYVYLTEKQASKLGIYSKSSGVSSFTYFNEPYVAIPVGLYFSRKSPELFMESMDQLLSLAQVHEGTPVAEYYRALVAYYMPPLNTFDDSHEPAPASTFTQDYHQLCYDAECAWVRYVQYAEKKKLPFIHIHPFERYATRSTKSHDLSLALTNPDETGVLVQGKERFHGNVLEFLQKTGLADQYPDMVHQTDRLIRSAATISLSARVFSVLVGTLAQNIPDEEAGKGDGIVSLFDTAFSRTTIPSGRGLVTRRSDPIGTIAAQFDVDAKDPAKFMNHYIGVVLAHELGHNLFRGQQGSFRGDQAGLSINLIEEAKATNNMALYYEDPYNLSESDLEHLRSSILLLATWSMMRLRPRMRAEYMADQYFREGGAMIDHMLKSGLIEIVGAVLGEGGEFQCVDPAYLDTADFEFLRFNFSDEVLRDSIKRCADFLVGLAPPYHETQFKPGASADRVVPDVISLDFWQALLKTCIDEDIAKRSEKDGTPQSEIDALIARKDAVAAPLDPTMFSKVRALIRYADFDSVKRFRETVAKKHGVALDDPALEEHVKTAQEEIERRFPAIRY